MSTFLLSGFVRPARGVFNALFDHEHDHVTAEGDGPRSENPRISPAECFSLIFYSVFPSPLFLLSLPHYPWKILDCYFGKGDAISMQMFYR